MTHHQIQEVQVHQHFQVIHPVQGLLGVQQVQGNQGILQVLVDPVLPEVQAGLIVQGYQALLCGIEMLLLYIIKKCETAAFSTKG